MHRIMHIDDEPEMRDLVDLMLRRKGFQVMQAENGAAGLALMRQSKPDLVLVDWMMPGMNGPEVIRQMQADEQLRDIPVIAVTAKSDAVSKLHLLNVLGVADYVTKPFSPGELTQSIKKALEKKDGHSK